jgi:hypothetical protein
MHKSKIVNVLKTYSEDEIKRFSDFLTSPYFNTNHSLAKFYNVLKKCYPDFTGTGASKEALYKKLYAGEKYNDQVMRNLSSQLLKLAKEFLTYETLNNEKHSKSLFLLNELKTRHLDGLFRTDHKSLEESLSREKYDSDLFLKMQKLEEIYTSFLLQRDKQSMVYDSISRSGEFLLFFSLLRLSDKYINLKINQDALNADVDNELVIEYFNDLDLDALIKFIDEKDYRNGDIIKLYYYKMAAVLNPDNAEFYFRFKDLLIKIYHKVTDMEVTQFFLTLEYIATYRLNRGDRSFYKEIFFVHDFEIKNKIYLPFIHSGVRALNFRNKVYIALRVGEIKWAEDYVKDFKKYLNTDSKEMEDYAIGLIEFEKGNYEKSIEALSRVKTEYSMLKVDIKYALLKSFYELGYEESVISQLNSFRHLLSTHKQITPITHEKGINFINLMNTLLKVKYDQDKPKIDELNQKLTSLNLTADRAWMEKKIQEISGKKTAI